jgi:hypothetical protein
MTADGEGRTSTDELDEAAEEGTLSAAEGAVPVPGDGVQLPGRVEVFIGEIPAPEDSTTILWTARCNDASHGLLGHFATREEAETAKEEHLRAQH